MNSRFRALRKTPPVDLKVDTYNVRVRVDQINRGLAKYRQFDAVSVQKERAIRFKILTSYQRE